jgi:hypothetical protein
LPRSQQNQSKKSELPPHLNSANQGFPDPEKWRKNLENTLSSTCCQRVSRNAPQRVPHVGAPLETGRCDLLGTDAHAAETPGKVPESRHNKHEISEEYSEFSINFAP